MRFVALQLFGGNEVNGCEALIADTESGDVLSFFYEDDDTTKINRALYDFLKDSGFDHNRSTGKVSAIVFMVAGLDRLVQMNTFYNYITPIEGIHNPCILYSTAEGIPPFSSLTKERGAQGIVEVVKKHYGRKKGKKSAP